MRKSPFLPWVLLLVACFTSSVTCANIDLAKRNACMSCHAIEKKLVGPAFKEVSSKYSQKENAANQLAQSIKKGGAGKWGPVPMPPPTSLSDQDALIIAKWIIEGAK